MKAILTVFLMSILIMSATASASNNPVKCSPETPHDCE
jgi:hypothetical protein